MAGRLLAAATRLTRLGLALPSVTSNLVSAKPSAFNFSSIRCARRRLKTNSATLRALIAPSDSAVCPTSTTIRNFAGSHMLRPASSGAASGAAARRALCARGGEAASSRPPALARRACFWRFVGFDEPLKISDSQPAWLASIGSSTNAAIAARRWRGDAKRRSRPRLSRIFSPDDSNPCFPRVIRCSRSRDSMAADRPADFNSLYAP